METLLSSEGLQEKGCVKLHSIRGLAKLRYLDVSGCSELWGLVKLRFLDVYAIIYHMYYVLHFSLKLPHIELILCSKTSTSRVKPSVKLFLLSFLLPNNMQFADQIKYLTGVKVWRCECVLLKFTQQESRWKYISFTCQLGIT